MKAQWFFGRESVGENPPKDPEPNWGDKEHLRALLEKIRVIVGGSMMASFSSNARKTYLWMVQSIQITGHLPKLTRIDNPPISFTEEDSWRLYHPYDDDLSIAYFNTRWVLVDNGSLVDILYYPTFQHMRIDKEWLLPSHTPLVGLVVPKCSLSALLPY